MTKKHFIALADLAIQLKGTDAQFGVEQLDALSEFCASQNPNFNRERWIAYINGECGKNGGKVKRVA